MILDIDKWCKETIINGDYLPEITSSSIRLSNGSYDSKGLFSLDFFGQERSTKWKTMYAKITIPHPIIHPAIFHIISRRISYLLRWINLDFGFVESGSNMILTNTASKYDYCGITDLYNHSDIICNALQQTGKFETLSAKTILQRIIDRKIPIFISNVIVMPPIFRPDDEDNKFYVKIIEEINILKSSLSSNDKILTNRILSNIQNIYNYLFDNMISKIKGKTGLIRGSMIGKNADFSGRAVIVGDPSIKPSQLGVPRTMLLRLFYPWIIHYIMKNDSIKAQLHQLRISCNIPALYNLINNDLFEKSINEDILKILNNVMEIVIKDKVILAKRDPVLHKLSVRGFYPVPIDDSSIHVSPLVCTMLNADFDGDQMAVFVPLTDKAQKIVKENMLSTKNLWHPTKGLSFTIEKDFVLGIYVMTKDDGDSKDTATIIKDTDDIIKILFSIDKLNKLVTYKGKTNTIGRRVLEILFKDRITVTSAINEKKLAAFLEDVARNDYTYLEDVMYQILQVSRAVSSIFGGSMSVKDFIIPQDLKDKRDLALNNPDKYDVNEVLDNVTSEFIERTTKTGQLPTMLVNSGARGSAGNIKQISVAKGYIADPSGKILTKPVKSNFSDGFKPIDYFISAYGSRKGVIDRVLNTAKSGYLQRQMVYLCATVKSSDVRDCGTDKFFEVILTEEYLKVLNNRVLSNGAILTEKYAKEHDLIGKLVKVYSPMYCKSRGLCRKCFPDQYREAIDNAKNVGIITGNIVGERASQLILRTFHCLDKQTVVYLSREDVKELRTIGSLYDQYSEDAIKTLNDTQDEIDISNKGIYLEDINGTMTKALRIIRHRRNPDSPMVIIKTRNGYFNVLQDNHPIAISNKKDKTVSYIEPKNLSGSFNSECYSLQSFNKKLWQYKKHKCSIDPYTIGQYVCNDDNDAQLSLICGDKLHNKHLPSDFIYYDNDSLLMILCGVIDSGNIFLKKDNHTIRHISITLPNFGILYQLKLICDKFHIKCNINTTLSNDSSYQNYIMRIYPTNSNLWLFDSSRKCDGLIAPNYRYWRFPHKNNTLYTYRAPIVYNDSIEDNYVYDIETESHTFIANGLLVHNTGGATSILYLSQEAPQVNDILNQDSMSIIAKKSVRIRVIDYSSDSVEEFASTDFGVTNLTDNTDEILVHFPAVIKFNSLIARKVKVEDNDAYLEYDTGEIIGEIIATATDVTSAVMILQSIMNHSNEFERGKDIVVELYETFRVATKIPLIFLEIIVSQLMRDPDKIYYPYRLGSMDKNPKFLGIKAVPSIENPTRGIMFERLLDTITNSVLLGDVKDQLMDSDLEDLFAL